MVQVAARVGKCKDQSVGHKIWCFLLHTEFAINTVTGNRCNIEGIAQY